MMHRASLVAALLALSGTGHASIAAVPAQELPVGLDPSIVVEGAAPKNILLDPNEFLGARLSSASTTANLTSFIPENVSIAKRSVIGSDDRQVAPWSQWPWRGMGRLIRGGSWCSAAMVGPRHVLTARHCLIDGPMAFAPGYDNGPNLGVSNAIYTYGYDKSGTCSQAWDFAIVVLQDEIGYTSGWFAIREFLEGSMLNQPMFGYGGYPQDRDGGNRLYGQAFIRAHRSDICEDARSISTDADINPGSSGGPLWAWGADNSVDVYGALSAGSVSESTFGGGNPLIQLWGYARATWA